ncbi:MAG: PIN domain-containing protein [Bryobacteraceae bacterium]|jgi:predicted nucleic acid-binding protein
MAVERVFVDTWAWLVLANDRDPAFDSVARIRANAAGQAGAWVTTDYVLDETVTRLFALAPFSDARRFTEGIFEASRPGLVDIEHVTPERFSRAWRLRLRYRDKPRISFTDLTSFVVMRELGLRHALTGNAHFEQVGLGFLRLP